MKTKTILTITAVLSLVYSLMLILMTANFLEMRGMEPSATAMVLTRLLGAHILGYAMLCWFGKDSTGAAARPILISLLVSFALACAVIVRAMMTLKMTSMGWSDVAITGVFALIYAYMVFMKKD